jgi:hypothetical protein
MTWGLHAAAPSMLAMARCDRQRRRR